MGVARQMRNQTVLQRKAMLRFVLVRGFNFHTRHINTRWAIALATFAAHTQVHGLLNFFAAEGIFAKLTT